MCSGLVTQPHILLRAYPSLGTVSRKPASPGVNCASLSSCLLMLEICGASRPPACLNSSCPGFGAPSKDGVLPPRPACLDAGHSQPTDQHRRCMHENRPRSAHSTSVRRPESRSSAVCRQQGGALAAASQPGSRGPLHVPHTMRDASINARHNAPRWCRSLKSSAFVPSLQVCRKPVQVMNRRETAR